MKESKIVKKEHVLCKGCGKPIHISEWGGVNKESYFHNNICCIKNLIEIRNNIMQANKGDRFNPYYVTKMIYNKIKELRESVRERKENTK